MNDAQKTSCRPYNAKQQKEDPLAGIPFDEDPLAGVPFDTIKTSPAQPQTTQQVPEKSFMDISFPELFKEPGKFVKALGKGASEVPRTAYDVGKTTLHAAAAVPLALGQRYIVDARTSANPKTFGRTYQEIFESKDPVFDIIADPLQYLPVSGALSYGSKMLKSLTPSRIARGIEGAAVSAKDLSTVSAKNARQAEREARLGGEGFTGNMTTADVTADQLASWKAKEAGVRDVLKSMPRGQRMLAEVLAKSPDIARWSKTIMGSDLGKAGVASAAGAAQGVGLDVLSRYLNRQEQGDAGDIALAAGLGGGLSGAGSLLQEKGLRAFPGMSNQALKLDEPALAHIKKNLPDIIDAGILPKSGPGYAKMAQSRMAELSPKYEAATEAVSKNIAGDLEDFLKANPSNEFAEVLGKERPLDVIATDAFGIVNSKLMQRPFRNKLGDASLEVPFLPQERLEARKALRNFFDTKLEGYEQKEKLYEAANKALTDAEAPGDFMGMLENFRPLAERPAYPINISRIEARLRAGLEKELKSPHQPVALEMSRRGELELPSVMDKAIIDKMAAMRSKSSAARGGKDWREVEDVSPLEASRLRTALTDPKAYQDNKDLPLLAKQKLVNRAYHDAVNEQLMGIDKYKKALGAETPERYALWRQLETLAEHPGRTGLQSRLPVFNTSVDPFRYPSLTYKSGKGLERAGRAAPIIMSQDRDERTSEHWIREWAKSVKKPKQDTTKTKK